MPYVATVNIPGYSPMDDEPPVFGTTGEAWRYLADERRRAEDEYEGADSEYSEVVDELELRGAGDQGEGTVYGGTPGYEGSHDQGLAYCVTKAEA